VNVFARESTDCRTLHGGIVMLVSKCRVIIETPCVCLSLCKSSRKTVLVVAAEVGSAFMHGFYVQDTFSF
jgi:hypothetical protein